MDPLGSGYIDLEPVAEAEQRQGAVPLPDQGVERAQQRLGMNPARDPGLPVQV